MSGVDRHRWDDDEALLADLTEATREVMPLSARIAEHARGALAWRTVDADLMPASFDSATEGVGSSRAGDGAARVLVFECPPLAIEVELQVDRIVGQLLPPAAADLILESAAGAVVRGVADEFGFFVLAEVPQGSVRLQCQTATTRLVTGWFKP